MRKIYIFIIVFLFGISPFLQRTNAQDFDKQPLPDGVRHRLGKGWVNGIEYSPDGEQFAVATTIGIWIYDADTGKIEKQFEGNMGGANAVSYSPDGKYLAAAHQDFSIRIWSISIENQGKPFRTLREHTRKVHDVIFSPDGQKLASASADKSIRLWFLDDFNEEIRSKRLPFDETVLTAAFSLDSDILAGGSDDGVIKVWDANTGNFIHRFAEHKDSVQVVDFSSDRTKLASASLDGSVILWSLVGEGGQIESTIAHESPVFTVKFSPDGKSLVTGSEDRLIRVWDTDKVTRAKTLRKHKDSVTEIDFSPDGKSLVSGSPDGTIYVWDILNERTKFPISGHIGGIKALAYIGDNRIRACGTGLDGKLRIWDAGTSRELSILRNHIELTQAVAFSSDGKMIVSGGTIDGTVVLSDVLKILNLSAGLDEDSLISAYKGNPHEVTALTFSSENTVLITGGPDGDINRFDINTGELLDTLEGAQSTITAICYSRDRTRLFSGEENGTIRQWDTLTGNEIDGSVHIISLSPITAIVHIMNDDLIVIGNSKGKILFVHYKDKYEYNGVLSLLPFPSSVTSIIVSKDEKTLTIGCDNGSIYVCSLNELMSNLEKQDIQDLLNKKDPPPDKYHNNDNQKLSGEQIAKKALSSTVFLQKFNVDKKSVGYGSGFVVVPGKIATNFHVIKGASTIYAKLVEEEDWYFVESIAAIDEKRDLAILNVTKIIADPLRIADSNNVAIGERVYAVGNPRGFLEGTVSDGIISGIRGEGDNKLLQMTAPISPGSSGGPVLNTRGEVIGIAVGDYSVQDPKYKINRSQNLNIVVPSNYLKELLKKVKQPVTK